MTVALVAVKLVMNAVTALKIDAKKFVDVPLVKKLFVEKRLVDVALVVEAFVAKRLVEVLFVVDALTA